MGEQKKSDNEEKGEKTNMRKKEQDEVKSKKRRKVWERQKEIGRRKERYEKDVKGKERAEGEKHLTHALHSRCTYHKGHHRLHARAHLASRTTLNPFEFAGHVVSC